MLSISQTIKKVIEVCLKLEAQKSELYINSPVKNSIKIVNIFQQYSKNLFQSSFFYNCTT